MQEVFTSRAAQALSNRIHNVISISTNQISAIREYWETLKHCHMPNDLISPRSLYLQMRGMRYQLEAMHDYAGGIYEPDPI